MKGNRVSAHSNFRIFLSLMLALSLALLSASIALNQRAGADEHEGDSGATVDSQVVGGTGVRNGEYPFITALLDRRASGGPYWQQFCGGTLIDRNSVLTAAHCVKGMRPGRLRITIGRTVLSKKQGVMRDVRRIYIHRKYRTNSHKFDAAVLKLKAPVRNVRPMRIPAAKQNYLEKKGSRATIAGWGNTVAQPISGSNRYNYPDRMQKARVPIRKDRYARSAYGKSYVPRLMIAAGKKGKDTCQGDSGGPMFKKRGGKYLQIGITSFGAGCAARGYPGVYTEVNAKPIRSFIMKASRR